MKKFGLFILIGYLTLGMSSSFGYLEKTAYCNVDNQNISIFLKKQEGTKKCKTYLDTIHQLALQKYNEINLIQLYISQGDDVLYWKRILKEKESDFLQLINLKLQIESYISSFEKTFFEKYKVIIKDYMEKYYSDLETQYYILVNQKITGSKQNIQEHSITISETEQQLQNIKHILEAKSLDDIFNTYPSYIYFKQKLQGR